MTPHRLPPGPGQESVWDYPRPPRLEAEPAAIRIVFAGQEIARTGAAFRVLETSHPPVYYLPPECFAPGTLVPAEGQSFCEWKGTARYFDIVAGVRRATKVAWAYPDPVAAFAALRNHVAVYPGPMDGCFVGGEKARPQPGSFYGGWITDKIVGPFKGEPGTMGW
ncbi:DUF427 domain-containing protein [Lichenihabitans sp. Uapishka_5]|uniref:DUF427 domain-containing protein n=1 Tax=Lichenihabitans sp. Uapishka_5 TaxID=3037302 RepID=UPI0029E7FED2|nr:DUF427 domain-containing protein [Lichenihabitans sp. Uapishka_5]MDX7952991.1 DUF427 domain-containing protein [Lichenihabitans sp. Uapishka_5]